jgi:hypothetical protein
MTSFERDLATPWLDAQPRVARSECERLIAFACVGGVLLLAGLALVMRFEHFRPMVYLVYVFMMGLGPPLAAWLLYAGERATPSRAATFEAALLAAKGLLLSASAVLVLLALASAATEPRPIWAWALIVVLLAVPVLAGARLAGGVTRLASRLDAWLVIALVVVVFVFSPFKPHDSLPFGFVNYALNTPDFTLWATVGVIWTAVGIWLRRQEGWAFPHRKRRLELLALAAVGLVIVGLYDDTHFVDFSHFAPIVGPALHSMRGGTPMVDTFSQYGFLTWFVHRLAFTLFEPTFGTAAVVTRLLDASYFLTIGLIVFFVARRRLTALWFFVPALIVAVMSHDVGDGNGWNMHALPQAFGGRYLVPAVMALLLVAAPSATRGRPWTRWAALALIGLASLCAIEQLVYVLAIWGYCLAVDSVRLRSVRHLVREAILGVAAVGVAQIVFIVVLHATTGALPNYGLYFLLVSRFRPSEDSHWSVPFVSDYAMWLPIGLAYFLVMATAGYRALKYPASRGDSSDTIVERLLPVAVFGLAPLSYFFGRPQEAALCTSCLPFAAVLIGVAEGVFFDANRGGAAGRAVFWSMAFVFAFTIADGFEHFMRPIEIDRGNATVLRRCLGEGGCRLGDVPRNIGLALHTQPLDQRTSVGLGSDRSRRDGRRRIEEVISMLHRLAPPAAGVALLTDFDPLGFADSDNAIGLTAFMSSKQQWFPWQITSPFNDGRSPHITARILERVASTPDGLLVIVPKDRDGWEIFDQKVWKALSERCRLSPVEDGKYHLAYVTKDCGA